MLQMILALLAGLPVGMQLGLTGAGGAIVAVPLLVYVAGVPVQQAVAMSLVIVAAASLVGVWEYGRAGEVRGRAVLAFAPTGLLGSWAGASAHHWVRGEVLLVLFGVLLLLARALMMRQGRRPAVAEGRESCAVAFPRTCWLKIAAIGLVVGVLSGFFGVGGGFMIVPALVLILKFPQRVAIGTSLSVIAVIALGGVAAHLQLGQLDPRVTALVAAGGLAGLLAASRLGRVASPSAVGRVTAAVTVSLALWLILVNGFKLLGGSL